MPTAERDPDLRTTRALAEWRFAEAAERSLPVHVLGAGVRECVDHAGRLTSSEVLD